MTAQMKRFVALLLGIFAVVSGVAQALVLEPLALRYATFGITLACALGAFFFFRKAKDSEAAIRALVEIAPTSGTTVQAARSEAEVREVWRMDVQNFVDHTVPVSLGLKWWKKYPDGLYVIRSNGRLLGYVSFWPLSRNTFKQFVAGQRSETEITQRNISPPNRDDDESFWYIGSIAIRSSFRKKAGIKQLIECSLAGWASHLNQAGRVSICALAFSKEGERLLGRFGFSCFAGASESPHELPVYVLESEVSALQPILREACDVVPSQQPA